MVFNYAPPVDFRADDSYYYDLKHVGQDSRRIVLEIRVLKLKTIRRALVGRDTISSIAPPLPHYKQKSGHVTLLARYCGEYDTVSSTVCDFSVCIAEGIWS